MLQKAARSYKNSLRDKLMSIDENDPKSFWNLISKMKDDNCCRGSDKFFAENLSDVANKYHNYFRKLYSKTNEETDFSVTVFTSSLSTEHRESDIMKYLNDRFTEEEVLRGI